MSEHLLSVGIDIGTSTTSMVVSQITVENTASCFSVPHVDVTNTEIIYRSEIYQTPQEQGNRIDINTIEKILIEEYHKSSITADSVDSGAVIITGESSRKENASLATQHLSKLAGEFVVATAGPDLESIIAAKGAGTHQFSKDNSCTAVNLDIGGGTTNIAVFSYGDLVTKGCWDIGGRLVRLDSENRITYISPRLAPILADLQVSLIVGEPADLKTLKKLTDRMAEILAEAIGLLPQTELCNVMHTETSSPMNQEKRLDAISFSGGVAQAFYQPVSNPFLYGDIGPMLAESIRENSKFLQHNIIVPRETIRATVIGAGSYTTSISGSTIDYSNSGLFPLKSVPAILLDGECEAACISGNAEPLSKFLKAASVERDTDRLLLCFTHIKYPSYNQIIKLSKVLVTAHSLCIPEAQCH